MGVPIIGILIFFGSIWGSIMGVPIIGFIILWGLCWGSPLFRETTIYHRKGFKHPGNGASGAKNHSYLGLLCRMAARGKSCGFVQASAECSCVAQTLEPSTAG